jgi:hypothetical protein
MKKAGVMSWAFCLFLVLPSLQGLAQPEDIRPVSAQDRFSHRMKDKFYIESWNYHMMLDTGEFLSIAFVLTNLGVVSGYAGVQLTLTKSGSGQVLVKDELSPSQFNEDGKSDTISIGPHSMALKEKLTRLIFSHNGAEADLTIHPWLEGFKVADGLTVIDKGKGLFYRTFIEIPRGDFEGMLTVEGTTRSIRGAVYMDHNISNVLPASYSSNWCSLRAFFPDFTVILQYFEYLPGHEAGRWTLGYVTDRQKLLGVSTNYPVDKSGVYKTKRCSVPTGFAIQMSVDEMKLEGTFKSVEPCGCAGVLDNYNWLAGKIAGSITGNPIVCRFRSHADLFLSVSGRTFHLDGPAYQRIVSTEN